MLKVLSRGSIITKLRALTGRIWFEKNSVVKFSLFY